MIEIENLKLEKGSKLIIENINVTVSDLDRVLIFARNGSGKSSLIKCITGLEKIKGGEIRYHKEGSVVNRDKVVVSYLPELYEFDESIVVNQLYKGFYLANLANGTLTRRVFIDTMYDLLEIEKLESQHFGTLSKGEQKRLLWAITLLVKYDCLILDEPYDGLDSVWRKTISDLIEESIHQIESPVKIIISSHIYDESTDVKCNKILTIHNNRVEVKAS